MNKDLSSYLKRCMQALRLSNRELSNMLTDARVDGQKTSEATISRWMTGATPPDPGVMLFFKTKLIELAKNMPPRPSSGKIIGVGGCTGGAGASSLSSGMALALNEIGYKVLHVTSSSGCNNGGYVRIISNAIKCAEIDPEEFHLKLDELRSTFDFVIVDLYSRLMLESQVVPALQKLLGVIDLLVSPVDIAGPQDVWAMERAYKILDQTPCANRLMVYFSKHIYIDDTCKPFFQKMKKWLGFLYPRAMPMVDGNMFVFQIDRHAGVKPEIGFQSIDLGYRYHELSAAALERLGIDLETEPIDELDFYQLVDRVAPR